MIIVYSKPNCPQCDIAKNMLKQSQRDFVEVVLEKDIKREDFIAQFPFVRQMPLITADGLVVGGVSDLRSYLFTREQQLTDSL